MTLPASLKANISQHVVTHVMLCKMLERTIVDLKRLGGLVDLIQNDSATYFVSILQRLSWSLKKLSSPSP